MQAFRQYGYFLDQGSPDREHLYTKALLDEQGFDGLPHLVTRERLDTYVAAGEPALFRGIAGSAARAYAEQLRRGELYVGRGGRGGGIFAAGGATAFDHARDYAEDPGSVVVRMSLKAGARVIDLPRVERQMLAERRTGANPEGHATTNPDARFALTQFVSVYAAYLGYDAVVDHLGGVWLILNRTALRIQDEDLVP